MIRKDQLSLGAWLLVGTLCVHSFILLVLEPSMGFRELPDFANLEKVVPALSSLPWRISNVMHVLLGLGLLVFSSGLRASAPKQSSFAAVLGAAAAPVFVMVGMAGFVGELLIELLSDARELDAALLGMIGFRMVLLYSAVALFGGMILALSLFAHSAPIWVRVLGVVVSISAIAFVVIPVPVPLFLFVWAVVFTLTRSSDAQPVAAPDT